MSAFIDELGQNDDALVFDAAFDMGRMVGNKRNIAHSGAAFGGKARTLNRQILVHNDSVTLGQRHAVAVVAGAASMAAGLPCQRRRARGRWLRKPVGKSQQFLRQRLTKELLPIVCLGRTIKLTIVT